MKTLTIQVTVLNELDFYENPLAYKKVCSAINNQPTGICSSHDILETDEDIKVFHKTELTRIGFTWDIEQ